MGRIRSIKPEFPQSETIGRLSREARLLFIQLWTIVDDAGRARGADRVLASVLYPYDADAIDLIGYWIEELVREGLIEQYESGGTTYVSVTNWLKHQKINRPSQARYPEPSKRPHGVFSEGSVKAHVQEEDLRRRIKGSKDQKEEEAHTPSRQPQREPKACPDSSVAARVLSERVGNLDIRFQEQMQRTILSQQQPGESLEAVVDRMEGQWQKYNTARAKLNYPTTSVRKFFESGTWHDEALWPWKEESTNGAHQQGSNQPVRFESVSEHNRREAEVAKQRLAERNRQPPAATG